MADPDTGQMPAYAQDEVFRQLLALARQAGITVAFIDGNSLEDGIAESDADSRAILMTSSAELPPDLSPASVLAEEMADILTESAPPRYKVVYAQHDLESMSPFEAEGGLAADDISSVDVISVALVQLAEMMVNAEVERQFKIIREIPRPD